MAQPEPGRHAVEATDRRSMPAYLDYNSTTPVSPRVITAMMPYFARQYGNASSAHTFGQEAHEAIDQARVRVAELLGCFEDEIVFTSGGSEANNLAIKGAVLRTLPQTVHVIASVIEHPSVLKTCYYLAQRLGTRVTLVPVDGHGSVDPRSVAKAVTPITRLVSIMLANNEVGTIQPLKEIVRRVREQAPDVLIHADAAQAVGKIRVDVKDLDVDLLTVAAHKFCGPKGVGALYVRRGVELDPLIEGAGHESGRRSGTENTAGIVGLGMAAKLTYELLPTEERRLSTLRDRLAMTLLETFPNAVVSGDPAHRLPNTLNIAFPGLIGSEILKAAPGVAASTGAACHSGAIEPSSVLLSMGFSRELAMGAIRLSIGRYTNGRQVDMAAEELIAAIAGQRKAQGGGQH